MIKVASAGVRALTKQDIMNGTESNMADDMKEVGGDENRRAHDALDEAFNQAAATGVKAAARPAASRKRAR